MHDFFRWKITLQSPFIQSLKKNQLTGQLIQFMHQANFSLFCSNDSG